MRKIVDIRTGEVTSDPDFVAPDLRTPATPENVNRERDRRIVAGASFTPAGYGAAIPVSGDSTTARNLQGLAFAAQLRIAQGDTTTLTQYRDEANVIHDLTPPQIIDLWSQGAAFVSAVFQASWALKDGTIPADFTNDGYWP